MIFRALISVCIMFIMSPAFSCWANDAVSPEPFIELNINNSHGLTYRIEAEMYGVNGIRLYDETNDKNQSLIIKQSFNGILTIKRIIVKYGRQTLKLSLDNLKHDINIDKFGIITSDVTIYTGSAQN